MPESLITWIIGIFNQLFGNFSFDTIVSILSLLVSIWAIVKANTIKTEVDNYCIKKQYETNRNEIRRLLNKCMNVINTKKVRPADSADFNFWIGQVLTSMERYLSIEKTSSDYSTFMETKKALKALLADTDPDDKLEELNRTNGLYGNLLGALTDINNNGRV